MLKTKKKKNIAASSKASKRKMDYVAKVINSVELVNIFLFQSLTKRHNNGSALPSHVSVNSGAHTQANKKENWIQVQTNFTLTAFSDKESNDELVRIEAEYILQYHVESFTGINKTNLAAFGEINGVFVAWPYWREFVQSATVKMGLPPLTMPLYRVTA